MFPVLLWIIGVYVAAAAVAHRVFRGSRHASERHYVLVAHNDQLQIEWYLRALRHFSRRTGTDIGITVVLDNSTDETGRICERFSRESAELGIRRTDDAQPAQCEGGEAKVKGFSRDRMLQDMEAERPESAPPRQIVWVDLGNQEDVSRLPL